MPGRKDANKPRGRMSSYAFFVQTCREEHKKKHPGEPVVFAEFTRKCAEKWKQMKPNEKKRFEEMAVKDKVRYDNEMATYTPPPGDSKGKKKKRKPKDPNAPKRALSAFFFFCGEERAKVRAEFPGKSVADVARELGKRWEKCSEKARFEAMAAGDKERFEKEITAYKAKTGGGGASPAKKAKPTPEAVQDDDDDDEEEEEEEEEEEDEDDD